MTGKEKKYGINKNGKRMDLRRCILCPVCIALAVFLTACTSKETILLEEEDLVRAAGVSGGATPETAGMQAGGWAAEEENQPMSRLETAGQGQPVSQPETAGQEQPVSQSETTGQEPAYQLETAGRQPGMQAEGVSGTAAAAGGAAYGNAGVRGGEEAQPAGQAEPPTLFVHICGEVMEPGVYELPVGSRIFEAVEAAGGFTETASQSYVNLALELKDGWKVEIPLLGEEPGAGQESAGGKDTEGKGNGETASSGMQGISGSMAGITEKPESAAARAGSMAVQTTAGQAGGGDNSQADGLVDINTATKQELCTLPGVGETRAESIISYREKNGGFGKIEDIMKVEGIKEGMFSKMKDKICVRGVE